MRPFQYLLAAIFATATVTATARASAAPSCDPVPMKAAQARQDEAIKLFRQEKFDQALIALNQGYAICASAKLLRNIVITELRLGEKDPKYLVSAARHTHQLSATDPDALSPEMSKKYASWLAEARKPLGGLIVTAPRGARVLVDGKELSQGYAPQDLIEVELGHHLVVAETNGHQREKAVDVPTTQNTVTVDFVADTKSEPAEQGPKPVAGPVTPQEPPPPPPPKVEQASGPACLNSGGCIATTATLGGLAVVGLVGGFLFDAKVVSAGDDARAIVAREGGCNGRTSPGCSDVKSKEDDADSAKTMRTVFYIGAGVTAAAAVATFVFWPKAKSEKGPSARAVPIVTPTGAGIGVHGNF